MIPLPDDIKSTNEAEIRNRNTLLSNHLNGDLNPEPITKIVRQEDDDFNGWLIYTAD